MNEEKKVPFKWEYGEETISLQLGMYANNQRLYIGMITHQVPLLWRNMGSLPPGSS